MHVLLIHQAFAALDEPGGTRHYELARCLSQRGHKVTIIASPVSYLTGKAEQATITPPRSREAEAGEGIPDDGLRILYAYTYSALHKSFVHRVFSFFSFMVSSFMTGLRVKNVDLVWGTSPPIFQGMTAWALSRLKHVPFLFEVRDLWPAFAVGVGVLRDPLLIRLSEWLERFLYRHANLVLVNSPGFIDHVRSHGAKRVELVPNGADPFMFDPLANGARFRAEHGLQGKFVALYAGAHGMSNDLEVVLDAAGLLHDRPEVVFVFLGDGKDKPALQARAAGAGLKNVVFIPPISKMEMGEALAAADACIAILKPIPLYATVYPNKVFDYMAAGRPVVLAIDGVIRKVVEENNAGLFVEPGNPLALAEAIRILADDREKGRAMGLNGRIAVERDFDRAKLAEELAELLTSIRRV
ncbi:MAG: putative glycosyltransferase [Chloroflexi bacterium]|nr:putative glycosyltransferase [Chloroflexota bacterium]